MEGGGCLAPVKGALQSQPSTRFFHVQDAPLGNSKAQKFSRSSPPRSHCMKLVTATSHRAANIHASNQNLTFYKHHSLHPHLHPPPLWTEPHPQLLSEDSIHILFRGTGPLHRAAACHNCAGSSLLSGTPERGAHMHHFSVRLLLWEQPRFAYKRSQGCYQ